MLVALPALCDRLVCCVLVRMENSGATKIPYHTSRSREESVLWGNHNTLSVVSESQERVTTRLVTSSQFFINSAQLTSLRYYHHRLVPCFGCPKAFFCFFCYHPWYSGCTRVHFETLNGSQRPYFFTQRDYFLLTEFQPTCCRPRSSRFWAISIFGKQCSSRPISTPSVVDATIRLSGLRSFNPKI